MLWAAVPVILRFNHSQLYLPKGQVIYGFDYSLEFGSTEGLGAVKGDVDRITVNLCRVHILDGAPCFVYPAGSVLFLEVFQILHFSILITRLLVAPYVQIRLLQRMIILAILALQWPRGITTVSSVNQRNLVMLVWRC